MSRELVSRLLHLVSAGRITVVDDSGSVQKLQVSERPGSDGSLGLTDGVLRIAQFGFSSSPPISSEVVLIRLWGNRTLTIAIGTSHQPSRPKNLSAGDAQLYSVRGQRVWLSNGTLIIDGAGQAIVLQNFTTCTVKGDLAVTGAISADGLVTSATGFAVGTTPLTVP